MVVLRQRSAPTVLRVACMLTDQVGDWVYIRGPMNGAYKVAKADPSNGLKMKAIGVIISKWDFTNALVQTAGELKGLYTGLSSGRTYYLGTNGRPVYPPPVGSLGTPLFIQPLGVALDSGVLWADPEQIERVSTG